MMEGEMVKSLWHTVSMNNVFKLSDNGEKIISETSVFPTVSDNVFGKCSLLQ